MMKVEILYFDGCPNVTPTVERLNRILAESGLNHPVTLTRVGDLQIARSASTAWISSRQHVIETTSESSAERMTAPESHLKP
jgi:hypothetical protein